jgi:bacillithiol biosynthesis cysteine-adding enzyme BshC
MGSAVQRCQENLLVKSDCLPFSQIPHTSRLFIDFLSYTPKVRQFYPRSPYFREWVKDEASALAFNEGRRQRVAKALERQNRSWQASAKTLQNIARLRQGAFAVVTGQQVGLFGGPAFALYKALTAVKLANDASSAGIDCVPVFWLASSDHDLAEVNHISIPGPDAAFCTLTVTTHGLPDAPVGTVSFGPEVVAVIQQAEELLGDSEIAGLLKDSYREGENFGSAFARLFTRLLGEWGVIFLDACDPSLGKIAEPIYRAAIESSGDLNEALLARGKELEGAGYHQQAKVTPTSTLLFALRAGARIVIQRRTNGDAPEDFLIGEELVSREELLRRISIDPEDFSPNVLLRPVVQDYLLPTLAYTGGAAETAYFAQAEVVYKALLGRVTPIVPRFSATIIEEKPATLLQRYGLAVTDLFRGAEAVRELLAARNLPQELQQAFEDADKNLENSLAAVREALQRLDKTLADAAENAGAKMHHQLTQLRARAARAELRQSEIFGRHASLLSNMLYPDKTLQEREIAGIYFLAQHGVQFLQELFAAIRTECVDHQLISFEASKARLA